MNKTPELLLCISLMSHNFPGVIFDLREVSHESENDLSRDIIVSRFVAIDPAIPVLSYKDLYPVQPTGLSKSRIDTSGKKNKRQSNRWS